MTRDEYLENHHAHEGAEAETTETRCPICGNDECETYAIRDGEIVGCNCCLCHVSRDDIDWLDIECPNCGAENTDGFYLRHKEGVAVEIVGCSRCVREVDAWRWEAKA